ncbi:MAG: hypothetical protein GY950_32695 [bacterium]|nr:hypothetical protein [bacterium]
MRKLSTVQMKKLFEESAIAIDNSKDNPLVLDKVSEFGYTAEALLDAEVLYKQAEKLYLEKGPKAGQKVSLSIQVKEKIDKVHLRYMLYVKIIRRDQRENERLLRELQLLGDRDTSVYGKIKEPKEFYKNCSDHAKLTTAVSKYGLSVEIMQAQKDMITDIEKDKSYRAILIKEAEKTTEDRNKVILQLYDWWLSYREVLKYVFKDDPQQLEAFNIKGYSDGYKPKSTAGTGETPETPEIPGGVEG